MANPEETIEGRGREETRLEVGVWRVAAWEMFMVGGKF